MSNETTGENTPVCWHKQEAAAAKGLLFKHGHLTAAITPAPSCDACNDTGSIYSIMIDGVIDCPKCGKIVMAAETVAGTISSSTAVLPSDEYASPPSIAEDYASIAEGVKRLASEAAAVETDWCHCDFTGRQVNYRGETICSGCFKLARD